jgi:uncharacterized protein (DUF1800 family)
MPLPNSTDLCKLDTVHLGKPFVQVEAKTLNTSSLDFVWMGQPFVAVAPSSFNVWVKIASTWKQANAIYVKVTGTWKNVISIFVKASGIWKT